MAWIESHDEQRREQEIGIDKPTVTPHLISLMQSIGLDVAYHRASGDHLFYRKPNGAEVEVLDLVGGYGSLLLGHHHPDLIAEMTRFLTSGRPVHAQGSLRPMTEQFAKALTDRVGGQYQVVLSSTGAEAVEAALKHAIMVTKGNTFIALEGAFHGKSLATLSLAGHASHREPFEAIGSQQTQVIRVRMNDVEHLDEVFASIMRQHHHQRIETEPKLAGFIFEPIQGEGGVHPMSLEFAQRISYHCKNHGIPLIADECQCGVGRTGQFLACEMLGIRPDSIILSKSLGGGLAKLAVTLINAGQYQDEFDWKQTNTYAGDELSSAIGLKVIELIDEPMLLKIRVRSERWLDRLRYLANAYPNVIAEVRGRGLMLAVELKPQHASSSFMMRMFSATEDMALLAASFLLREHRIRVAPTLSCPNTLRIQSSAMISDAEIDRTIEAFADFCEKLEQSDAPAITEHLANVDLPLTDGYRSLRSGFSFCSYRPTPLFLKKSDPVRRVAWLCHLIDDTDLYRLEPSFSRCTRAERERLLDRLSPLANPVVLSEVEIRSVTGQSVWLYPILLPITSAWMKGRMERGETEFVASIVQKGIDQAEDLGCSLAALGQYTSIVTRGGRRVRAGKIGLCTGNTYSLAIAIDAIAKVEASRSIIPSTSTCAVIGAGGNIGQTAAQLLSERYQKVFLLGSSRKGATDRLRRLAETMHNAIVIDDPERLRTADVVLAATSSVDRPLHRRHFAEHAIVCDLSVPTVLNDDVTFAESNLTLIQGGIARLPFDEDLNIVGFPLEQGLTYGCMAEALLLGFEGISNRDYTGRVQPERVRELSDLGRRHGLTVDGYKDHCVLGTTPREEPHVGVA